MNFTVFDLADFSNFGRMYRKNLLNKFSIKLLEQFFKGDPVGFWSHYNFDLRQ